MHLLVEHSIYKSVIFLIIYPDEKIQLFIIGILLWVVVFLIIRLSVNKKFVSEKRIQPKNKNFKNNLFLELQIFYHIEEKDNQLILKKDKFDDLVATGKIIVELHNPNDPISIKIIYHRKIKFLGYFIILSGIALCYIGAIIPILIVQDTKKKVFEEVERVFSIVKLI